MLLSTWMCLLVTPTTLTAAVQAATNLAQQVLSHGLLNMDCYTNIHDANATDCLSSSGEPIPHIQYTESEQVVWATALRELKKLFPQHACKEYLRSYPLFDFRWAHFCTCSCSAPICACRRPCVLSTAAGSFGLACPTAAQYNATARCCTSLCTHHECRTPHAPPRRSCSHAAHAELPRQQLLAAVPRTSCVRYTTEVLRGCPLWCT
jgi:hypothetical protein